MESYRCSSCRAPVLVAGWLGDDEEVRCPTCGERFSVWEVREFSEPVDLPPNSATIGIRIPDWLLEDDE